VKNPSDPTLREMLMRARTVAVVGASSKADRPSLHVMQILMDAGYRVIPVTPVEAEVLGQRAVASLADVPVPLDIVDVFRRASETPAIADQAVAVGAKVLWLQLGIWSNEAAARAEAGGLTVVMNRCIGQTVLRLGVRAAGIDASR
jgi:predicted CoA-binding protein